MARWTGRTSRLILMLVLNLTCFITEFSVGFMCNSMVLTTDSFNVLSDFLGVVIALVCMKIAAKGPSERNTFGWMRCEVLGALINSVFMIALCMTIFLDSIQRFIQPKPVDQPRLIMIVGIAGLTINLIGMFVLRDYRSAPKEGVRAPITPPAPVQGEPQAQIPENTENTENTEKPQRKTSKKGATSQMNMYGAYLHILGDALGSVVVIICALIDWQVPNKPFLQEYLDPSLSILVAIMLTISSVGLMKQASLMLLQAVPTNVNLMNLKSNILEKSPHIAAINNLNVWQFSGEQLVASVRVQFVDTLPWEIMVKLISQVEQCFYDVGIHVVTVHPEVIDGKDGHSIMVDTVASRKSSTVCRVEDVSGVLVTSESPIRVAIHPPSPSPTDEDISVWM